MSEPSEKPSRWSTMRPTVEPVVLITFFVVSAMTSPTTDLVMRQACRQFGMDHDHCRADKDVNAQVQRLATNFNLSKTFLDYLPGCMISIFAGPWANAKGRKPFMISSLAGSTASQFIMAYLSSLHDIKPYYLLISSLTISISGGPILVVVSSMCYTIDVSSPERRFLRMAILTAIISGVPVLANLVAPDLVNYGYPFFYGLGGVLLLANLIYIIFFLPESIDVQKDVHVKLFTFEHFKETATTYFKRRPNNVRGMIIALSLLGCSSVFLLGDADVKYQSMIQVYKWDLKNYSTFNAVLSATSFIGTILGVYIGINLLHINELLLGIIVMGITVVSSFLLGLEPTETSYYIISEIQQCFSGCIGSITRGVVSNIVPHTDIGVIISFMTSLEAFMPQVSGILYVAIYNATVETYPLTFHFVTTSVSFLGIICILTVIVLKRRGQPSETKMPTDEVDMEGNTVEEIVHDNSGEL